MDSTQLRNIAFLMSLGGLSVACPGDEKGETDSDGNTGGPTTGTSTTATTGTPTTSGSTGDAGTGTDGGTTTTGETTGTPTTSGTTGAVTETTGDTSAGFVTTRSTEDTEGTTGEPAPEVPACTDFGDKFAMCFPDFRMYAPYYAMYCNQIFAAGEADGAECTAALEEFFACINALECMDFGAELMAEMPVMCAEPFNKATAACPSFGP